MTVATQLVVTYDTLTSKGGAGGIYRGSGAPNFSAALGSLYIRTDPADANSRLYINSSNPSPGNTWVDIAASA